MSAPKLLPGFRKIEMSLDRVVKPIYSHYGMVWVKLMMDWELIVGPTLAAHSKPIKLAFKPDCKTEGLLVVEVYHSSLATQMLFMEPLILEKIATFFGYKAVAKMRILQKPMFKPIIPPSSKITKQAKKILDPELVNQVEKIDDPELQESLKSLLTCIS